MSAFELPRVFSIAIAACLPTATPFSRAMLSFTSDRDVFSAPSYADAWSGHTFTSTSCAACAAAASIELPFAAVIFPAYGVYLPSIAFIASNIATLTIAPSSSWIESSHLAN